MGQRHQARIIAFQGIFSWEMTNNPAEEILAFSWLDDKEIKNEISIFASLLLTGTIDNIESIDKVIKDNIDNWDFSRITKVDLAILRISAYSLLFQNDIPASVTIDEAINMAKEFGTDDSYRFINGVLDGIKKNLGT
ncbi:MAG: transcription antitermination factor NusB [Spirochaetales bacterium]|nr:transcription antitermination factor NusB [Spirochaetales bacterium]